MIHDKTLLFSAASTVKTATLSEPLTAFERFAIVTTPNTFRESTVSANCNRRIDTIGSYNTDGYMIWPTNVVVGGDTTTLNVNHFQLLMQQGTSTATRTFGFNNTANNCNRILEVYGINRKNGTTAQGEGSPGDGYTAYNETLLASGLSPNMTGDIQLSERANAFQRLKVGVGAYGENVNIYDVDAPINWTAWMPLYSYWGTNTGSYYFSEHRYKFSNSATVLTPISGKTHQLGTAAANPYSTTGNYTSTDTHVRHPLFAVWGINKKSPRKLTLLPSDGGTLSASDTSGYEYDQITLSNIPDERCRFSGYSVTGATLVNNVITLQDQNASAHAGFEHAKDLTLINSEHGTLSADAMSGFSGDVVTVDATTDEGWYFTGMNVTGATATGNQFTFVGNDVTAEGLYTDQGYPITYLADDHVQCTGDTTIYIPGGTGITLQTGYDTYYRISGYDVTGGYIENGVLYPTGPCTARAVAKVNAFTATGTFNLGTITRGGTTKTVTGQGPAILKAFTGSKPSNWPATNANWSVSNASSYGFKTSTTFRFNNSVTTATNFTGTVQIANSNKLTVTARVGGKSSTTKACNLSWNTTQGLPRVTGTISAYNTYSGPATISLSVNAWTATGYAP